MQEFWIYIYIDTDYVRCAKLTVYEDHFEFEYVRDYLDLKDSIGVEPIDVDPQNLPCYKKKYQREELFSALLDSAPDYWGRQLLNKKFNQPELNELEYVLANGLEHVGALAYSGINHDQPMQLTPNGWQPHKKHIVELEQIIEQTEMMIKDMAHHKLKELFEFGPTLGGGRPKVSLILNGKFYIAKYGTSLDTLPEQKVEFATMKMAKDIGLDVPEINIASHAGRNVFFIERFDRVLNNNVLKRFHFNSALTLCGWFENKPSDWNYPEFCECIRKNGRGEKEINADLKELFRRVAFNIAVNNNDDHPRNHGLLYKNGQWRLSPLYDVLPSATSTQTFMTAMALGAHHREASKRNLLSARKYFDLENQEAEKLIDEINGFVSSKWKAYFKDQKISNAVIKQYENAFITK